MGKSKTPTKAQVRRSFILSGALFVLFLAMTLLVKIVDVQPIGPNGTSVGFAKLNAFMHKLLCHNTQERIEPWYKLSDLLGILNFLAPFGLGLYGLQMLINTRSFFKVNYRVRHLIVLYVIIGVAYILFMKMVVVNYRPVLEPDGSLEPSFPSSHTLMAVSVMGSAMTVIPHLIRNKTISTTLCGICCAVMIGTVGMRVLSGAHWFTDILAGIILGAAVLALYNALVCRTRSKLHKSRKRKKKQ